MTRIIAGAWGGRSLRTPPGDGTRPTSDRVREALFSALYARDAVSGVLVLDLYAGSGALGLEALSRGATRGVFIESDARAASVVTANLRTLNADGRAIRSTVASYLGQVPDAAYDLVFIDPPYAVTEADLGAVLDRLVAWLAPDALVVVERSTRSPEPTWPTDLEPDRVRRYGETAIWFATLAPAQNAP